MDSAERTKQVYLVVSGKLNRRRDSLPNVRIDHQSELMGVGLPRVRHCWNDLVLLLALLCEFDDDEGFY